MRFSNFNFAKSLTEVRKVIASRICLALVAFFVCLSPQEANAQSNQKAGQIMGQIKGYAVQVAALSSQRSADELVRGLNTRGINAYWVGGAQYSQHGQYGQFGQLGMMSKQGQLHRVRIGNFPSIESAYKYAEKLLGSGLLDAYAIAAYEPPAMGAAVSKESSSKVQSFAQKYQGRQFSGEAIDMIASIGTRGWLLLSSRSMNLTAQQGNSALSRELAKLAAAVGSRGWRLNNNIANFLAAPAPVNLAAAKKGITGVAPVTSAPSASRANSGSLNVEGPEIRRETLIPAYSASAATNSATNAATGARPASSKAFAAPPRLQGSIEMRDGRMWMKLRNTDSERSFSGMARVTLSTDKDQQDVTPMQFTLPPDQEESFPVDEATLVDGNWILMVYDQNGAARLVRGASLAPKLSPDQASGAANSPNSVEQNSSPQGPPAYVTGVYDATGWAQPQTPSPVSEGAPQGSNAGNSANGNVSQTAPAEIETAPGQVVVTPRQIAVTTENVTLEFDISAQNPLNYIIVTLRAGDYQDVRQALMSTPQGRVPFLIPVAHTSAGFYYEVKDEAQRTLASGSGDFRRLVRGN